MFYAAVDHVYHINTHIYIYLHVIYVDQNFIPSKKLYFRRPDHVISMECSAFNFRCQSTQQKLQSICAVLTFDPQHKKMLNYFICIKNLNAETITSVSSFSCLDVWNDCHMTSGVYAITVTTSAYQHIIVVDAVYYK
jgi:hypothetical protein